MGASVRARGHRVFVCNGEVGRAVFCKNLNENLYLEEILSGFEALGAGLSTVCDSQLVDCITFGSRNADQYSLAIDGCRLKRFTDQIVEVMERLSADAERRQVLDIFLLTKRGRQELDERPGI